MLLSRSTVGHEGRKDGYELPTARSGLQDPISLTVEKGKGELTPVKCPGLPGKGSLPYFPYLVTHLRLRGTSRAASRGCSEQISPAFVKTL